MEGDWKGSEGGEGGMEGGERGKVGKGFEAQKEVKKSGKGVDGGGNTLCTCIAENKLL